MNEKCLVRSERHRADDIYNLQRDIDFESARGSLGTRLKFLGCRRRKTRSKKGLRQAWMNRGQKVETKIDRRLRVSFIIIKKAYRRNLTDRRTFLRKYNCTNCVERILAIVCTRYFAHRESKNASDSRIFRIDSRESLREVVPGRRISTLREISCSIAPLGRTSSEIAVKNCTALTEPLRVEAEEFLMIQLSPATADFSTRKIIRYFSRAAARVRHRLGDGLEKG